ncbi:MAG TPA: type II secretion system protein GspM [Aliidongia sp.]|uniref:type II secretion system protein GspM n=1 Tax=Aliidongia sp. TaxID=1914230 RepID=UPI002DDDB89E|nr:type II secretion system protein GspM [Aliidongia sp.]HEV2673543.1 type II secretion system protein GspM [Aliidongia sp.]
MAAALPTGRQGRLLAVGLVILTVVVAWLAVAAPLMDLYADQDARLAQRAALADRMSLVAEEVPALQARAASVPANNGTATFEGATDALAGASLQSLLQSLASTAGAGLSSLETLTADQAGPYRRIGVKLSISAPLPVLVELMAQIEQAHPPMLIDDLQIHGSPIVLPGAQSAALDAGFTVYGFRGGTAP